MCGVFGTVHMLTLADMVVQRAACGSFRKSGPGTCIELQLRVMSFVLARPPCLHLKDYKPSYILKIPEHSYVCPVPTSKACLTICC
jgi:hypothetical protein